MVINPDVIPKQYRAVKKKLFLTSLGRIFRKGAKPFINFEQNYIYLK